MRNSGMGRMTPARYAAYWFIAVFTLLLLVGGCVSSETIKKPAGGSTPLVITKSGDIATIQWKTHHGYYYTLMYAASRSSRSTWQPLPRCQRIPGDGRTITITDHVPYGRERHYRLHIEP